MKTALKTSLYLLEQSEKKTSGIREQVKDKVEDITDRARQVFPGEEDHTLRNAMSIAAGIGLGVALGMLFAPASGEQMRRSIMDKAQETGARVRERFSPSDANDN